MAALMALTVILLGSASPAMAECATYQGDLLIPVGHNAPLIVSDRMEEIHMVYIVEPVFPTKPYGLEFVGTPASGCIGSNCAFIADFDVAWYNVNNVLISDDDFLGDQIGSAPTGAHHAVIYMAHGPDAGTSDGSVMARFRFTHDC